MKKVFTYIFFISLFVLGFKQFLPVYKETYLTYFSKNPCATPITYSLGQIDPRFGLSKPEVQKILLKSEGLWETALSQNLFDYSPEGEVKVNFIYDERQAATERLKKLDIAIDNSRASYEKLKNYHENKEADYELKLQNYQNNLQSFEQAQKSYEEEVSYWNSQNGAPEPVFQRLETAKNALNKQSRELENQRIEVNNLAADLNLSAGILNDTAKNLNLNVEEYNTTSSSRGEEFQEGVYTEEGSLKKIEIYQFTDQNELTLVLTHELGHALGLEHTEDPKSVMHYLSTKENSAINSSDIAEFNRVCKKLN